MTALPDLIRAELQRQRTRWKARNAPLDGHTPMWSTEVDNNYQMSDLGVCHDAIRAVLNMHQPRNGWCVTCDEEAWYPCNTVRGIADALRIQQGGT